MKQKSPEQELATFIAKYTPEIQRVARDALARMRKLVPGAIELVYDNYNALAIAFGPSDRIGDVFLSVTLYPRWVSVFFVDGVNLPDPKKLLKGSGKGIRHIVLEGASALDTSPVRALVRHAIKRAKPVTGPRRVIIKSISARQRPRRPPSAKTKQ